jgi:hypothetical protein
MPNNRRRRMLYERAFAAGREAGRSDLRLTILLNKGGALVSNTNVSLLSCTSPLLHLPPATTLVITDRLHAPGPRR